MTKSSPTAPKPAGVSSDKSFWSRLVHENALLANTVNDFSRSTLEKCCAVGAGAPTQEPGTLFQQRLWAISLRSAREQKNTDFFFEPLPTEMFGSFFFFEKGESRKFWNLGWFLLSLVREDALSHSHILAMPTNVRNNFGHARCFEPAPRGRGQAPSWK